MKKEILKFVTGTLVNVLMSIIILSLLGLPFAGWLGLVTGIVLPMPWANSCLKTLPWREYTPKYGRGNWSEDSAAE